MKSPTHRHVERALDIASCLYHNGHLGTLCWCAAGMPDDGFGPDDVEVLQVARSVVHENNGTVKPGDDSRVLRRLRQRRERMVRA
jgi:hypothetical protein